MAFFVQLQEETTERIQSWVSDLAAMLRNQLSEMGLSEGITYYLSLTLLLGLVVVLCVLAYLFTRVVVSKTVGFLSRRSSTQWDDILVESKIFSRISWLAPALVVYLCAGAFPDWKAGIQRVVFAYMILVGAMVINALLNAVIAIYKTLEAAKERSIRGFVEVARVALYIVAGVLVIAALMGRSPGVILTGIGAATAVLLLVFRDSLLGLVASFQISSADMVREGDWIEMPKYNADGDVIKVSFHTVKVRNWDKTISTIPTYALVSDAFKNWRGMEESGGRRIKRSVYIDMNSIRFCTDEELRRFEKIRLLGDYIREKREEVEAYNKEHEVDNSESVNGRRLTNVGTFRAYVAAYLRNKAEVHQGMTFLVRHLQPTEHGLPIQIYVFSRIQAWPRYEAIQADIFDHILAVVPEFGLKVFQSPSGSDFTALVN